MLGSKLSAESLMIAGDKLELPQRGQLLPSCQPFGKLITQ
jgi:hypothetical protein